MTTPPQPSASKARLITETDQPKFPCWLWNVSGWWDKGYHEGYYIPGTHTHYNEYLTLLSPAPIPQPEAPTERPDKAPTTECLQGLPGDTWENRFCQGIQLELATLRAENTKLRAAADHMEACRHEFCCADDEVLLEHIKSRLAAAQAKLDFEEEVSTKLMEERDICEQVINDLCAAAGHLPDIDFHWSSDYGYTEAVRDIRATLDAEQQAVEYWKACWNKQTKRLDAELEENAALRKDSERLTDLLEQMLNVAKNADETGYVTDCGFIDLDKLHAEVRAAIDAARLANVPDQGRRASPSSHPTNGRPTP